MGGWVVVCRREQYKLEKLEHFFSYDTQQFFLKNSEDETMPENEQKNC